MAKSIFTNRVTRDLAVPDTEPVQTVVIRKLAGRHLEAAAVEAQRKSMANVKVIGGPALVKEFMAIRDPKPAPAEGEAPKPVDPMNDYDATVLVQKAVLSWTFDEPLSAAAIEEMDDEVLDWLAREVLRLAKPKLFMTDAEREAARGNV